MYPLDLDGNLFWNHDLDHYANQLNNHRARLFSNETSAEVILLGAGGNGSSTFSETKAKDLPALNNALAAFVLQKSPSFQHCFIRSKSSLDTLSITSAMFEELFSKYKVLPTFLDFVFTFGEQPFKKNFHYSGFRSQDLWLEHDLSASSACHFQICYNLRGVEPTEDPPEWPWSIRQSAIFHSFQCDTGKAAWINIKGSDDISTRIKRLCGRSRPSDPTLMTTAEASFRASLATHIAYCQWSCSNWAAYISWLEDELQSRTRYASLARGVVQHFPGQGSKRMPDRAVTAPTPVGRVSSFIQAKEALRSMIAPRREATSRVPDIELGVSQAAQPKPKVSQDFTYDDLRKLQYIEDQANITLLVISSNINTMTELRTYYGTLAASEVFQNGFNNAQSSSIDRFSAQVMASVNELKLQQSRIGTLLQLLADRKSLLLQLFSHRNMSTSQQLADKARDSSEQMRDLTEQMKQIALKTEKETIFMRIITVVTLFFLPGTFVATLMSTDIVRFQDDGKTLRKFSGMALGVYLAITIPIMVVTFWAAFHFWHKAALHNEEQRQAKGALVV